MKDRELELRQRFGQELDDLLFSRMELNASLKRKIRQEASHETPKPKRTFAKSWKAAAIGLLAAVCIALIIPLFGQSGVQAPTGSTSDNRPPTQTNGGAAGTELSQLTTTALASIEEAKAAFGDDLRLPAVVPQGYALTEMTAVGMPGQPVRDIVLTYTSGEHQLVFSASRMATAYPAELFTKTKVGRAVGAVFEQPGMTELYWTVDKVHYGVIGPIAGDEAMKMAESAGQS